MTTNPLVDDDDYDVNLKVFHVVFCILLLVTCIYIYVSCNGSNTSVWEERVKFSAIVYLLKCGFPSKRFPISLGAWDELLYFIVALPWPSI